MEFIDLKKQYGLIEDKVDQNIKNVLRHGQYIMGPEIQQLETQLSDFTSSKYCITNSSGTDALLIALLAIDIKPGDEILTSPFTFFATGEVISLLGARPVFVDIDPNTYTIDPHLIESKITSKTKAIIPVSLYGLCAEMQTINQIAEKYRLVVIEDAAQSFGSTYNGKRSCNLSTIGCTSFFPSKPLGGYGDSGACFTNNEELALKMKQLRIHGQNSRYHHSIIGINGRMDTIQAAILLAKLEIFEKELTQRQTIGANYNKLLSHSLKTQNIPINQTHVFGQYTVEVENRSKIQSKMQEFGIPTTVHYPVPMHLQEAYRNLGYKKGDLPFSEKAAERVLSLPMHPYLSSDEQSFIAEKLLLSINK